MTDEVSDVATAGSHVPEQSLVSEISALRQRLTIAEREFRASRGAQTLLAIAAATTSATCSIATSV